MTEELKPSSPPDEEKPVQQIRHDLVNTAVNFLLNPAVIDKPHEHKRAFLRKKGLTEAEISLAFEKAESNPNYKQILQNSSISNTTPPLPPPIPIYRPLTFWSQLSRFSSSLIVLGVAVFGAHYVYKNYIEPLIFGESSGNKSKQLEKQLTDMTDSLCQLEKHVSSLEESLNHQKEQMDKFIRNEVNEYYPTPLALRELKTEIASVKSLLLNRHQFPALPKVTPTIPHWQLPSNGSDDDASKQNGEASVHQHSDETKDSEPDHEFPVESNEDTTNQINGTNDIVISEVVSLQPDSPEKMNSESAAF